MRRFAFLLTLVFALTAFTQLAFADGSQGTAPQKEMTLEERLQHLGLVIPEDMKGRFEALENPPPTVLLNPDPRFDWRELGGVTPAKDQGSCGSCWDFAGVGAVESAVLIADTVAWDLSEQHIIDCNPYGQGCSGGNPETVYNYHTAHGAQEEACYPYRATDYWPCREDTCIFILQTQGYIDIPNNVDYIKNALLDGPVSSCFYAAGDFRYNCTPHRTGGINHAIDIVGWDDTLCTTGGWICKNSWGAGWGDHGFFYINYSYCGIGNYTQRPIYASHLPELTYEPEAMTFNLPSGGEASQDLTIGNTGVGDLHYRIRLFQAAFQDSFGYYWLDSDNPEGPDYDWLEVTGVGQVVDFVHGNYDNGNSGPKDLGFDFEHYGNTFSSICICSNGWASFTDGTSVNSYDLPIPSTYLPNDLLAPFWTDLNPGAGGDVYYYTNSVDSAIISWEEVYDKSEEGIFTFQIVLVAPDTIVYQYESMGPEGYVDRATIGMENGTGTVGLQVSRNQIYTYGEKAVEFYLSNPPGEFDWLESDNDHGTIPEEFSWDITITCSAGDHPDGRYWGIINLYTNDPDSVHVDIPVVMNVGVTSVGEVETIALSHSLKQNYPNPFNPATEIRYNLPERANVRLEIYNLSGQRLETLVNEPQEAGVHWVTWDASGYSSGVYFYKLTAGDRVSAKRMTLLR